MQLLKKRINSLEFPNLMGQFSDIYFNCFSSSFRRRVTKNNASFHDDGALAGPSIEDLLSRDNFVLNGFFVDEKLVGFGSYFVLSEEKIFADYVAIDPNLKEATGMGKKMIKQWLTECETNDLDVIIDVESDVSVDLANGLNHSAQCKTLPDAKMRERVARINMQKRLGYFFLDDFYLDYGMGSITVVGIKPRPSRKTIEIEGKILPIVEADERQDILKKIHETYFDECSNE